MKKFIKDNIFNIISVVLLILSLYLGYIGYKKGYFHSLDTFRTLILEKGAWGPIVFMVLQVVQIVVPVIPGGLTCVAGVLIFGPFWGFIYNYISICLGSILVFFISRTFGRSIVVRIFGQDLYDKYKGKLNEDRYERFFALAIFLPVAPDDFLCYLTGLTRMSIKKFVTIILLCKPASIFAYSMGWSLGMDFLIKKFF
uniref:TVP38/TMEM64 family protein n=1 Tax=Anaerococcus mediterraneensis TaxID=1870984 RepID=UPI00093013BD|nr:TVP38/TMEM64 family protein [Anaerococcus mediterraneensis]